MHHQAYTASAAAAAAHHQYKVPRLYFKIPRVLPYKEQREKFETDDYFKKLARESEVRKCLCYLPHISMGKTHLHQEELQLKYSRDKNVSKKESKWKLSKGT